jgi:hypothetical protein
MPDLPTEALDRLKSAIPSSRTIFHYTSQEGLLGIVNDKAIWLSSIRHLSDATEFGYALDLVRRKLIHKLGLERGPLRSYYGSVLERLDGIEYMTLLVGSFSESADLLSQWRAYTPSGIGFSIGFEYDHLKSMAEKQGFNILKCIYDQSEHERILEDLVNLGSTLIEGENCDKAVVGLFVGLFKYAPALKDPSFFEEQEWRVVSDIVVPSDMPLQFRAGKSMLVPYQEFKLAADDQKMPISRIIVGPTPHMNLSISSLGYRLASSSNVDPDTYTISPSRVPYRSW